ncbi:MAG: zinc ribbon domain-containing protein [Acidobacteria bacterium]|nr:zinc ribbon domain-containing protein [Acidobacteriota bacterium]MCA1627152.1 zinc ribbon domain-containing protein [Acidobacteriota bacterium]
MYCPSCGSEERQLSQFCRACGTDLRVVRTSLESPDAITASAVSAREHIGLAIADQIRQMRSGKDLEHIAEEVLPAFEKFLESPEERRLRRLRAGVITSVVGFAVAFVSLLVALSNGDFFLALPGFVTFMIGLGIILNGLLFTVPRKQLPGGTSDALAQEVLDSVQSRTRHEQPIAGSLTNELGQGTNPQLASVTEHTTHHLKPTKS